MKCFADYDVFYETMFWQCSTQDYMKFCFKAILLIITYMVGGICVSSRGEIIKLSLITTFD